MPHVSCTVCGHRERENIDAALRKGSPPLRELALQVGLTHSALWRHKQHLNPVKGAVVKDIPAEISKLRAAQTRAKRKGDTAAVLSISREIRAWLAMEAKAESAAAPGGRQEQELTRGEAVAMAKAVIESELNAPDVSSWLKELFERTRVTEIPTVATSSRDNSHVVKPERLGSNQMVESEDES
jgi:hypothetical protein